MRRGHRRQNGGYPGPANSARPSSDSTEISCSSSPGLTTFFEWLIGSHCLLRSVVELERIVGNVLITETGHARLGLVNVMFL